MAENKVENSVDSTLKIVENAEQVKTTSVSVSEYVDTYADNGDFISSESESYHKSATTVEQIPDVPTDNVVDSEKLDNVCEKEENAEKECNSLKVKCADLESKLNVLTNSYNELKNEYSKLEEYKANKENELKVQVVECALNEVSEFLSATEISDWREKSLRCSNVDAFQNELKAFAFDIQKQRGIKETETIRNSIPVVAEIDSGSIWDKLEKN